MATGVPGLDEVLRGGLPAQHVYVVEGEPGSGKTTLGLQFLLDGARRGERVLYVTLSESERELRVIAAAHGWLLDGIQIFELSPAEESVAEEYTILNPSEVELGQTMATLAAAIERANPMRVVVDSLSEMRLLARDPLQYRRQIAALKQLFIGHRSTVLLLDDGRRDDSDLQLRTLAHGVVLLEQVTPAYGAMRRRLRIAKLRGVEFRDGYHDVVIRRGGLTVYPRLRAVPHATPFAHATLSSDVASLDALVGGGLHRGTSTLVLGPAGVGKSTIATQYAIAAACRGERAAIYLFEETIASFRSRVAGIGFDLDSERGHFISIQQLDPGEISPGEFAHDVCACVDSEDVRVVVIDSVNGYLNAVADEKYLVVHLHELLSYLNHRGVLTLLIVAQHGILGTSMLQPLDISYLADTVLLLRYFEAGGAVRQAISVVKRRSGPHERTIRELRLGPGVIVGEPLRQFHGVLSGVPVYAGSEASLDPNGKTR